MPALEAFHATRLVAAARWRTVRATSSVVWMWAGVLLLSLSLAIASQLGDTVRVVAESEGRSTVAGMIATGYVRDWVNYGFGSVSTAILGFALVAALVVPLVSSSAPTLMAEHELVGARIPGMYAFGSAMVAHVTSLVTIVQGLALTALAGLLTIDGTHRARALLISWALWGTLVLVAQAALWGSRAVRRTAPKVGLAGVVLLGACTAGFAIKEPGALQGLFGLAAGYSWWLVVAPWWVPVLTLVATAVVAGRFAWSWCRGAVATGTVSTPAAHSDRRTMPIPSHPVGALWATVARTFVRSKPIASPLLVVTALAATGAIVAAGQPAVVWGIGVGMPLAVGLVWTENAAAMTGRANLWLASLPKQGGRLLWVWAAWAWVVSVVLVAVAWAPALVLGRVSWSATASVMLTGAAAASTVTAASLWRATSAPEPARVEMGDSLLTASRAMSTSIRLMVGPGLVSWLATSGLSTLQDSFGVSAPIAVQAVGAGGCLVLSVAVLLLVSWRWSNPTHRATCLAGAM